MGRTKYYYDKHSLKFAEYRIPLYLKVLRGFSICCAVLFAAGVLYFLADHYLPSQKEKALMREIDEMRFQYNSLNKHVGSMASELERIQERDRDLHRFVFGIDPIDESVWTAGIGGHDKYGAFAQYPNGGKLLVESQRIADQLDRKLSIQLASLDTLEYLASSRADRFESIPSIKPVRVDLLKRNVTMLSGYGMRLHPVHKVRKLHMGIDFTAPRGTPIQATGDGVVKDVRKSKSGYGRHIVIDHGFGYETLYAHMQNIDVREGEEVRKGQQIGTVGSTGTSTAPHCHYEVRHNGRAVDPIHYCLDGLSADQYKLVVDRASSSVQSFD